MNFWRWYCLGVLVIILTSLLPKCVRGAEATYYADELVGRKTASGHRFTQYRMTCAVQGYPLGTTLRVSYRGKSVIVVVTDRPDDKTDCDLTKRAFKMLAPLEKGRLRGVKIERIRS